MKRIGVVFTVLSLVSISGVAIVLGVLAFQAGVPWVGAVLSCGSVVPVIVAWKTFQDRGSSSPPLEELGGLVDGFGDR